MKNPANWIDTQHDSTNVYWRAWIGFGPEVLVADHRVHRREKAAAQGTVSARVEEPTRSIRDNLSWDTSPPAGIIDSPTQFPKVLSDKMNVMFFRNAGQECHAIIDPPHAVLESFLEDEVGVSESSLPFGFKTYSTWLERVAAQSKSESFGGDAHGLTYADGITVEHDYGLHPPTNISTDQFRRLLANWLEFVKSGEQKREIVL
jgi:hypothetical protein